MKKLLLSSVAVAAISIVADAPARAVDMPVKAPAFKAAAAPYDPWTGCYIGGNVGGGWAHKEFGPTPGFTADSLTANPSNVVGGVQIGCDVQRGAWVFGARGMFDWSDMHGNTPFASGGKGYMTRMPWFATATARAGYLVQPTLLIFVDGGAAFVRDEFQFVEGSGAVVDATGHVTRTGWTAGVGVDWMVAPNWTVTLEYGYMGFGTKTVDLQGTFAFIGTIHESVNQHVQVGLISLNYRFASGGGR